MTSEAELDPDELESDADASTHAPAETEDSDATAHLKDLEDGAGCAEIWSHLSESREE
ncbi:hypothetical protein C440_12454 [Haloferax mucosum ATCC BAA-1512]|uniref:Uncharacterized protein n=1 Tax=Haloferax mucosum ATCC BAA-1512 TaxID=662479 RepID=M0I7Y2_9EURY|nr:hypothetical protein [Haloferax mucosum]ELZ92930.1 hypothetical protein C440_12454 [Haloferax mucosum ATCC BAA-1512]